MLEIELKPCPFCGGEAIDTYNTHHKYIIYCENENCMMNQNEVGYESLEEAIEAWNRRADMQEIFEKIKGRLQLEQGIAKRYLDFKTAKTYGNAIEIVNQVAEEYCKPKLTPEQREACWAHSSKDCSKCGQCYVPDKNVGENDEFCEWIRDNDEFDVYDTKCRNRHVFFEGSPEDNEYVYCPYCGKEIKVVE